MVITLFLILKTGTQNWTPYEFIQQLQDVYDEEGDMEIAIKIDDNDLGSEPIVVKSTVYEQLYIVKS